MKAWVASETKFNSKHGEGSLDENVGKMGRHKDKFGDKQQITKQA